MDLINETHTIYMLTVPFSKDNNNMEVLFERLATLDAMERMHALGFTYAALGVEYAGRDGDDEDEERNCERAYAAFKARCNELLVSGVQEFLLVHAIVVFTLAILRNRGDQDYAADTVGEMRRAVAFFREKMEAGDTDPATAESMMRMAEERGNNALADAELDRERYDRFCSEVVAYLL